HAPADRHGDGGVEREPPIHWRGEGLHPANRSEPGGSPGGRGAGARYGGGRAPAPPPVRPRKEPARVFARTVTLLNSTGLHARPAGLFVETAARFRSTIKVVKGTGEADGRSLLSLMLLEATAGSEITIQAVGEDESEAV